MRQEFVIVGYVPSTAFRFEMKCPLWVIHVDLVALALCPVIGPLRSWRLATLTEEGLLEKRRYSERPPREEYLLTASGRDFLPVLFMIGDWGRKHRGGGRLTRFVDAETGIEIQPVAVDAATGAKIGTRPIQVVAPE